VKAFLITLRSITEFNGGSLMKVAITAKGTDMNSEMDQRFGRCGYFLIVDTESMEFESIENRSAMATGGAGPQAVQTISKTGVKALITGNVGPNAYQTLEAAGIEIYTAPGGKVAEMVEKFKKGELTSSNSPTVDSHAGMR
jgi:predicted Fe-Mo cluster-binding NifX family protein